MRIIPELRETASKSPDNRALVLGDREITFSELVDNVNRLSGYLRSIGIQSGDHIAIWTPNCIEFVYVYFAVLQVGAVCIPIDVRLGKEGVISVLEETKPKVFFTISPLLTRMLGGIDRIGDEISVVMIDRPVEGAKHLAEAIAAQQPDDTIEPKKETDTALILYTSGTSGASKGVMLAYNHLELFPEAMQAYIRCDSNDSYLCVLPMSHISGPILCNSLALLGSSIVIVDSMNPEVILEAIERGKPTLFHCVATIFNFLLLSKSFTKRDLGSLRLISMMGEPIPLWLMHKYNELLPNAVILQGYGLTETSPQVTLVPVDEAGDKMGSIGKVVPRCEVAIVDKDGKPQPARVVGEIIVRGPQVMKGYYLNPEKTDEVIRDGWFHTGDLGWMDEDGFFYHAGRADEVILTGGLMVYPPEVEQVISQHPDVIEVVVDGLPDPKRGQFVRARVVLKPNSTVKPSDLLAFTRPHLESYKAPRKIEIVDSLAKSGTGKVQRKENSGNGQ